MRLGKTFPIAATAMTTVFLILPMILSVTAGLTVNYFQGIRSGLTLKWVAEVWALYSGSIWLSLWLALACLAVTMLIGVPAAYALIRHPGRLSRMVEEFVSLPLSIPGLALALALLQLYGTVKGFRVHWSFILTGHVLYTLPYMLRSVMAVMAYNEPATSGGGCGIARGVGPSPLRDGGLAAMPLRAFLLGALTVVTLSIGEFNLTWMLACSAAQDVAGGTSR